MSGCRCGTERRRQIVAHRRRTGVAEQALIGLQRTDLERQDTGGGIAANDDVVVAQLIEDAVHDQVGVQGGAGRLMMLGSTEYLDRMSLHQPAHGE